MVLLWNLNETVLFEKHSSQIDETLDVPLPRTSKLWRWDWLIENPHDSVLGVMNFTVTHHPVTYPERQNGIVAVSVGISMIVAASAAYVYFKRQDRRPRRRN